MLLKNNKQFKGTPRHFGFDPVDLISGAYSFYHSDFKTQAQQGIDWHWEWDSASYLVGSLGNRITFSYDSSLEYLPDDSVMVYADTTGRRYVLPLVFDGDSYRDKKNQIIIENKQEVYSVKKIGDKVTYYFSQSNSLPTLYLLTEIRDDNDFTTQLTYDAKDYLMRITDSNQAIFTVKYNELGLISQVTHNQKILVQYHYTADGNLASVTDEIGEKIEFTYDNYLMTKRRDKNGNSFHWQYDEEERVVHTWGDGHLSEGWLDYHPDEGYNVVRKANQLITAESENEMTYYYDETGLVSRITYMDYRDKFLIYNENYRLTHQIDPDKQHISYVYNDFNQLIEIKFSDGATEKYRYDETGKITYFIDRLGKETFYEYNQNQLSHISYDKETIFEGIYDKKLLSYVKVDGNSYDLSYDDFGRLIKRVADTGEIDEWAYDVFGNCIQRTELTDNNKTIYTYHYDAKNRLLETRLNARLYELFSYDVHDNILTYEKDNQEVSMTYDKLDNISSFLMSDKRFDFSYNREGQLTSIRENYKNIYKIERDDQGRVIAETTFKDGRKVFSYDILGRLVMILNADKSWRLFDYEETGRVYRVLKSDGTQEDYSSDNEMTFEGLRLNDLFRDLTQKNLLINGLEELGIQYLTDISRLNLNSQIEKYLTVSQFVRPIKLPHEKLRIN